MRFKGSPFFVTGRGFIGSAVVRISFTIPMPGCQHRQVDLRRQPGLAAGRHRKPQLRILNRRAFARGQGCASCSKNIARAVLNLRRNSHVRPLDRSLGSSRPLCRYFNCSRKRALTWRNHQRDNVYVSFLHHSTDEVFGSLGEKGLFTETTATHDCLIRQQGSSDTWFCLAGVRVRHLVW